ncbi:MAG: nucleotidyl transferase AbiEii/AbiGii toxin family protein [Terriglobales bacterium]
MSKRDLAASVRQRLLNQAHAQGRPFQELLQYYAIERFLYRLAQSSHCDKFILKGALLLTVWQAPLSRSTVDIDLLGKTSNKLEHIASLVSEICGLDVEADGVKFDPASIKTSRIKEDADYEGIRVRFRATLAGARIPMQIDIGFGDVIVPRAAKIEYPTLLEFPAPVLQAYPKETVIAEKLEALTVLATLNSRMKDFFDLWALSRVYPFEGPVLVKAIKTTFDHRSTAVEPLPEGLNDDFGREPTKSGQWTAFLQRARLTSAPSKFVDTIRAVREFAHPPLSAAASGDPFEQNWEPGGSWSARRDA